MRHNTGTNHIQVNVGGVCLRLWHDTGPFRMPLVILAQFSLRPVAYRVQFLLAPDLVPTGGYDWKLLCSRGRIGRSDDGPQTANTASVFGHAQI